MLEKRLRQHFAEMKHSYDELREATMYSYEDELQLKRLEAECEMVLDLTIQIDKLWDLYSAANEMLDFLSDIERSWNE